MATRRPSTSRAVARALKARQLHPWEEATAALARRLALEIDAAEKSEDIARLSGRLLLALRALGMTRDRAPAGALPGTPDEPRPLDGLRAERARLRNATPGHQSRT